MKNTIKKIILISVSILGSSFTSYAVGEGYNTNKFYISAEGGYAKPIKKSFKDKDSGAIGIMKGSEAYEGKIGYRFHENMAIEIAYSHRQKYGLKLTVPDKGPVTNINGTTKVKSSIVMLDLVYFAQSNNRITPYFLVGLGYARVTPQTSPIYGDIIPIGMTHEKIGNIVKFTTERLAYRIGAGIEVGMTNNLALTLGGKIEVVNHIALHTRFKDPLTNQENDAKPIKKTIGIGEITAGLKFSF